MLDQHRLNPDLLKRFFAIAGETMARSAQARGRATPRGKR